jgi:hypothetical protein
VKPAAAAWRVELHQTIFGAAREARLAKAVGVLERALASDAARRTSTSETTKGRAAPTNAARPPRPSLEESSADITGRPAHTVHARR